MGEKTEWEERIFAVFSPSLALQQRRGLQHRLLSAQEALKALTPEKGPNSLKWKEECLLQAATNSIVKKYKVEGLLQLSYEKQVRSSPKRKYAEQQSSQTFNYKLRVSRRSNISNSSIDGMAIICQ